MYLAFRKINNNQHFAQLYDRYIIIFNNHQKSTEKYFSIYYYKDGE